MFFFSISISTQVAVGQKPVQKRWMFLPLFRTWYWAINAFLAWSPFEIDEKIGKTNFETRYTPDDVFCSENYVDGNPCFQRLRMTSLRIWCLWLNLSKLTQISTSWVQKQLILPWSQNFKIRKQILILRCSVFLTSRISDCQTLRLNTPWRTSGLCVDYAI